MQRSSAIRNLAVVAAIFAVAVGLDFGLPLAIGDSSIRQLIMMALCNVLVAISLNIINGMAGQFSIGHAGFIGIGAYGSAIVASNLHEHFGGGDPTFATSFLVVPLSIATSAIIAAFFGLIVGLPSLRLRGDYLAIVTLGFAEIFRLVIATAQIGDAQTIGQACSLVGGEHGIFQPALHCFSTMITSLGGQNGYAGPDNAGVPLYAGPFWIFGLCAIGCIAAWRIKFSGWGRALRALREDEIAAAAVGVDPTRYKVTSFVLAATGGGIAGGLMALMRDGTPIVQPESFGFQTSFDAITMVILGGSGSVSGSVIGALLVTFTVKAIELAQGTAAVQSLKMAWPALDLNALRMMIYGAVLVAMMIWRPEGLLGERELFGATSIKRKRGTKAISSKALR